MKKVLHDFALAYWAVLRNEVLHNKKNHFLKNISCSSFSKICHHKKYIYNSMPVLKLKFNAAYNIKIIGASHTRIGGNGNELISLQI